MKILWQRGEKTRLAKKAEIPLSFLIDILHGRKAANADTAERIEKASGGRLSRLDVLYPLQSKNRLICAKKNGVKK